MPFVGHAVGYAQQHREYDPMRYIDRHHGRYRVRISLMINCGQCWACKQRPGAKRYQHQIGAFKFLLDAKLCRDAFLVRHKKQVRFVRRMK